MDALLLSRLQFADTAAFHIIWPLLSIGLALYMLVMESMWLYTKKIGYYHQLRFWTKIFVLTFGLGVASGFPLSFQFGTNWAMFSDFTGDFFGNILGFESTVAFALEASFLAILVFGWKRVPPLMHLFANAMVFVGATLSAFWIMAANSWMQVPRGIELTGTPGQGGTLRVVDYYAAIFNPDTFVSFGHMWVACVEATLFFMLGICAWQLWRKSAHAPFYLDAFKYCLAIAIAVTPVQIVLGHASGLVVAEHQPQKFAAVEQHYDTNAPGTGAPLTLVPGVTVPGGLSFVTTGSPTGRVQGLNDFPADVRPTQVEGLLAFWAFRVMAGIGFFLFFLMLWGSYYWYKRRLEPLAIARRTYFLWAFIIATPMGFIATLAGWMTREIGRQPWVLYNIMRTKDALSQNLAPHAVATTLGLFTVFYIAFMILFVYFTYRIIVRGPNLAETSPYA